MTANELENSILIVDDSIIDRILLEKIFQQDYRVIIAADGEEALERLRDEPSVSLILLDISMPRLDGYGVMERLCIENVTIPIVVVTSLDDAESQIRALDLGASDVIGKPFNPQIVLHRVRNIMDRRLANQMAEQNRLYEFQFQQQQNIIRLSEMDEQAHVYNKQTFCRHTAQMINQYAERRFVLVRWDIDRFKVFNDIYGTQEGDRLLAWVGDHVRQYVQTSLATYGHLVSDHFALCLELDTFDPKELVDAVTEWLAAYRQDFEFVPRFGAFVIEARDMEVSLMCDRAMLALRSTKGTYARRFAYYDESMRSALLVEQRIVGETAVALEQGQFQVYLQPQYNYADGCLIGAKALVRWIHPERGVVPPGSFIPILERNGMITRLDEFVWEETCRLLRRWQDDHMTVVPVSVNISRVDVYNPQLCERICALTERYGLSNDLLRLEITESAYMENAQLLIGVVNKLRDRGFTVEMDDFGSGYSSLNMLKDVTVDVLKMDMKFLGKGNDTRGGNILSSVVRMAHWLKLPIIAEGVEHSYQADYLKSIGCIYMQGYHFARPMPVSEFEALLMQHPCSGKMNQFDHIMLDNVTDFWDATAQNTLLFNSYVGGAAIIEYANGNVEALRVNDKFLETLGTNRAEYLPWQTHILDRLVEEDRPRYLRMLEEASRDGLETGCEVRSMAFRPEGQPFWTRTRARCLAKNLSSSLYYIAVENIDVRKRLANENQALSERLRSIIASVPGALMFLELTDHLERIYANENAAQMFGYTTENLDRLFAKRPMDAVHPEDRPLIWRKLKEAKKDPAQTLNARFRHICGDGSYRWVQLIGGARMQDTEKLFVSLILVDIQRQVEQERRAKAEVEQQSLLKALYDTIPCGIMEYSVQDGSRRLVRFNEEAWRVFGYASEEEYLQAVGGTSKVKDTYPEDMPLVMEKIRQVMETDQRIDFDHRILCVDGSVRWVRTILQRMATLGDEERIQCAFVDITQLKERSRCQDGVTQKC